MKPQLPPFAEAQETVYNAAYQTEKAARKKFNALYKALLAADVNPRLLAQYVGDATLNDDDEQKEGNDTSVYADLAMDYLKELYEELGLSTEGGSFR